MNFSIVARLRFMLWCTSLIVLLALLPVKEWIGHYQDSQDTRPPLHIIFIGNSRTFANDMPFMVRTIADSAHCPQKYEIAVQAPGGISLEDHWNNATTQSVLHRKWDYVVLQGRSNEQVTDEQDKSFHLYGQKLAALAKTHGSTPLLYVTWRYSEKFPSPYYQADPMLKLTLQDRMQKSYALLSAETGAPEVNVGKAWEKLRLIAPGIELYKDDTHPSIYGSYLTALMFYRFFSHDDVKHVTFVPEGISPHDADIIKSVAAEP